MIIWNDPGVKKDGESYLNYEAVMRKFCETGV